MSTAPLRQEFEYLVHSDLFGPAGSPQETHHRAEPDLCVQSVNYNLGKLLARAEVPA
jgi:hypothetical protein